jgi:hypothetical protein
MSRTSGRLVVEVAGMIDLVALARRGTRLLSTGKRKVKDRTTR